MDKKKLNVGAGRDIRPGWVSLDSHDTFGADIVFNLYSILDGNKLPFKDGAFSYVLCRHVLEDFSNPVPILDELCRVCDGVVEVIVPCDTIVWATNLYHRRAFTLTSLMCYAGGNVSYGVSNNVTVINASYVHTKSTGLWAKVCCGVRNLFPPIVVEYSPIKYLFPVAEARVLFGVRHG